MTEAPPRQQRQQSRRAEYAAAIALIASSQAPQATKSVEIADILLRAALDAATIPAEAAAKVAKALAELVVVQRLLDRRASAVTRERQRGAQRPQGDSPGGAVGVTPAAGRSQEPVQRGREVRPQRVEEDEILRRALYTINAARRMALDISKGRDPMEALEKESRFFLRHTEEQQRRRSAKRLRAVAVEEFGPVLGWLHAATRQPEEPRHLHEQASGFNFRADGSAPRATGGDFPGEKPNCTCAAVAPFPGAMILE